LNNLEGNMNSLIKQEQAGVWILGMNRPDKHNALDTSLTLALLETLREARESARCRAIVLHGIGPSFCAGADTSEFKGFEEGRERAAHRAAQTTALHEVFNLLPQPVVAAVHGNALGGGAGLALACDLLVAAETTRFGYPELRHGICPAIVMGNLTRQLGRKQAFELVSTGRILSGGELHAWGLANQVVLHPDACLQAAMALAERWAEFSAPAMAATKRLFYRCADATLAEALQCGLDTNIMMRSFSREQGVNTRSSGDASS